MTRYFVLSILAFGFCSFAINTAIADDLGVGKSANTSSSTDVSTDDDLGVGSSSTSWFDQFFATEETDGSE